MSRDSNQLVGRPHWSERWAYLVGGSLLSVLGLAGVLWKQNPWGLVFLAVGAVSLSELRRRVVVRDGRLHAQGRFVQRTVDLADLEQVAVSPMAVVWVQPRGERAFSLHMVSRLAHAGSEPGVWEFPGRLRDLATAQGARLADWEAEQTIAPPDDVRPAFSR